MGAANTGCTPTDESGTSTSATLATAPVASLTLSEDAEEQCRARWREEDAKRREDLMRKREQQVPMALFTAAQQGDARGVLIQIAQGADVNAQIAPWMHGVGLTAGDTAMHVALRCRQFRIAKLLLMNGAHMDIPNDAGQFCSEVASREEVQSVKQAAEQERRTHLDRVEKAKEHRRLEQREEPVYMCGGLCMLPRGE